MFNLKPYFFIHNRVFHQNLNVSETFEDLHDVELCIDSILTSVVELEEAVSPFENASGAYSTTDFG
jgi:hypothetical protein